MVEVTPLPKPKRIKSSAALKLKADKKCYCEWCGLWKTHANLEQHHIRSRGAGGDDTDTITLCAGPNNCHGRVQRYEIERNDLRARKEYNRMLDAQVELYFKGDS